MLLALDTATTTASLAIYDLQANQLLGELTWQARRRQTQDLLPAAEQLLSLLELTPAALTALAVTTGPGSFTGVRIGISTVKGIALGLPALPQVIGLPTLSVTAAPWLAAAAAGGVTVCACIQAGRGRYNWVFFPPGAITARPGLQDHHAGTASEFAAALAGYLPQPIWLVGELAADLTTAIDGLKLLQRGGAEAQRHRENPLFPIELSAMTIGTDLEHVTVLDAISTQRRASQLARLAARYLAAGEQDELATLEPLYLRNP